MFWVISHCYEVIFHLWQSLSGRGEPVRPIQVYRSDLSTFSVTHFLLLVPVSDSGAEQSLSWTMTLYIAHYSGPTSIFQGCHLKFAILTMLTQLSSHPDTDHGGLTLCFIGILSPKTFSQVSVFRKGTIILYFAQDLSEIITFNLTTSIMSLVKYVFYFYWPGGILSTWAVSMPKNCFLENKINLSGII